MNAKFKVGDQVRLLSSHHIGNGMVGEVVKIQGNSWLFYHVLFPWPHPWRYTGEEEAPYQAVIEERHLVVAWNGLDLMLDLL